MSTGIVLIIKGKIDAAARLCEHLPAKAFVTSCNPTDVAKVGKDKCAITQNPTAVCQSVPLAFMRALRRTPCDLFEAADNLPAHPC